MTDNTENNTEEEKIKSKEERTAELVHHLTRYFFYLSKKGAEEGASLDELSHEELAELAAIGLEKGGFSAESFTTEGLAKIATGIIQTVRNMEEHGWSPEDYERFVVSGERKKPQIPKALVPVAIAVGVVLLCFLLFSC